jgi:predicted enzyme related to lactoylglutathione lyase
MATKKGKKKASSASRSAKKAATKKASAKKPVARKSAAKRSARKTPKPRGHQVVHWEIQAQSPARLHKFYGDTFGWKIDANNPMQYGMVASGGSDGIDGGIGGSQAPGSRVVVYTTVPDIPPLLDRIATLGGKTIMPRTDIGPVVMALYEDPEGNVMGLIES